MCGIVGGVWYDRQSHFTERIKNALHKLEHRGPDDQGYVVEANQNHTLALAHRRLSIIDLSAAGRQPMSSADGRFILIFNGEIYNYKELRYELNNQGYIFQSDTDTEVLLYAWACWGASCLTKLAGMFAFVIYDNIQQKLFCARDAFGIKPFFYYWKNGTFIFGSEVPALLELLEHKPEPDWQKCYDYLVHGCYEHDQNTFFQDIKHLLPGHYVIFDLTSGMLGKQKCWWKPEWKEQSTLSFNDAAEKLRHLFLQNVRMHLRSDVPLGAALSGGIDSSAVTCCMRYLEPDIDIHTFSFIATGYPISEEKWADHVISHIRAIPHKIKVDGNDLIRDLDTMIHAQGEPFGSTSIYAQFKVFQLAKESGITVVLDGQGADELLAGYLGYPGHRLLSLLERGSWLDAMQFCKRWSDYHQSNYLYPFSWLARVVLPDSLYAIGRKLLGRDFRPSWLNIKFLKDAGITFIEPRSILSKNKKGRRVIEHLGYSLQYRGLPSLLRHADRNSMHFSIESRVPFLTIELADFLLSLPEYYLIAKTGETKAIFRQAMRGIVPDVILERKDKIGFATPENAWLLSSAADLLKGLHTNHIPMIKEKEFKGCLASAIQKKDKLNPLIWRMLNFVKWHEMFIAS